MRRIFILLAVIAGEWSSAQVRDTTNTKDYKNSFSVNASSLLERIFRSNGSPDLYNPFLYYMRDCGKLTLRAGVNGSNKRTTEDNMKASETTIRNRFSTGVLLGTYWSTRISKAFTISYGLNLLGGYMDSTVSFLTTVDRVDKYGVTKYFGAAPGILLKYEMNSRLSLFAEYQLPVTFDFTETGTRYSLFPDENTTDRKLTGFSLLFYNPMSVYLSFSF